MCARRGVGWDSVRGVAAARGSYSAAWASSALPSGGILPVTNTFMSRASLINLQPLESDRAGQKGKAGICQASEAGRARGGAKACA